MIKNVFTFLLVIFVGVAVGFGGAKLYLYATKQPCDCDDKNKVVKEWTETPEFLKN